ncbi:cation:proton antiporter regulatory subunit [Gracilibacillus sp. YIM 98692]|uniref:cation:proton antiporter regulatory subunit n=1 Tax=Gracilibacillus sp. YIM 98692 TaxID=2663532 RepID=UPI0013D171DD|nr:cation:proton antiporter regulatory subunit [Gracilibacillus sp. YIM 98692]
MNIQVSQLPGIGQKISMRTAEENMLVVVVHHSGKRELYFFHDADDDEADFAMDLTPDETRELGAQLLGATYQPVNPEQLRMFKKQIVIDYITLSSKSRLANKAIGEAEIRKHSGATIIGIIQGDEMVAVPDINHVIQPGDVLMTIGKKEQVAALEALCKGED